MAYYTLMDVLALGESTGWSLDFGKNPRKALTGGMNTTWLLTLSFDKNRAAILYTIMIPLIVSRTGMVGVLCAVFRNQLLIQYAFGRRRSGTVCSSIQSRR